MKTTCFGNAPLLEEVKKKLGLVIKDGAITTNKIADKAVTEGKLADGAVTTEKIEDETITAAKLADDSVTTDKISDGAVNEFKIGDNAVITEKIADNAVSTDKIKDKSITLDKVSDALAEIITNTKNGIILMWDLNTYASDSLENYDGLLGEPSDLLTVGDYAFQNGNLYKYEGDYTFTMQDPNDSKFEGVLFLDTYAVNYFSTEDTTAVTAVFKLYYISKNKFERVSANELTFDYVTV